MHADYHDPATILAEAAKTLDLSRPVAVLFMGVLGYEPDLDRVRALVGEVLAATAPGSYLVFRDGTDTSEAVVRGARRLAESGGVPYILRSPDELTTVFAGLEFVEPGLVDRPLAPGRRDRADRGVRRGGALSAPAAPETQTAGLIAALGATDYASWISAEGFVAECPSCWWDVTAARWRCGRWPPADHEYAGAIDDASTEDAALVKDVRVAEEQAGSTLDTNVPQTARIWNYLLGGKDNFAVDRAVGDEIITNLPHFAEHARLSRRYLVRAVRYLAGEVGIRQFLDIGTGLPTADNTHEVAQAVAPEARIVYVDNDPLVLMHARALLTSSPEGATDYLDADLQDPVKILEGAAHTLDLSRPVALMLMGVLGHVESDDEAKSIIDRIMAELPAGSHLAMYDGSDTDPDVVEAARIWNISANPKYHLRSPERIAGLFAGLDLVEPGVVPVTRWRPDAEAAAAPAISQYCAVGRKL